MKRKEVCEKMNVMYKCSFCEKTYEWYDGIYENPNYDFTERRKAEREGKEYSEEAGVFVNANSFVLKRFEPLPEKDGENFKAEEADGNLEGLYINICPDCMRKLLDNLHLEGISAWDFI